MEKYSNKISFSYGSVDNAPPEIKQTNLSYSQGHASYEGHSMDSSPGCPSDLELSEGEYIDLGDMASSAPSGGESIEAPSGGSGGDLGWEGFNPGELYPDSGVTFVEVDSSSGGSGETPQLSGIDFVPVEVAVSEDGDIARVTDGNGNTYYAELEDGAWIPYRVENAEGESLDLTAAGITYYLEALKANGFEIEGIEFSTENNYVYVFTNHGDFLFDLDMLRCKYIENGDEEYFQDHDMYSLFRLLTAQYGGYQGLLDAFSEEYINDETIRLIVENYFPDEEITEEQLELLFSRMRRIGCGYVACVNAIFDQYSYLTDEEWLEIFGFERTNAEGDYNYQYMFLDFFLFYQQQHEGFETMDDLLGNESRLPGADSILPIFYGALEGANGLDTDYFIDIYKDYLEQYGIDIEIESYIGKDDNYQDAVEQAINNGDKVFIGTESTTIYYPFDVDGDGLLNDPYTDDTGAHAFTITGVTEDGKWIVSTWSREFIMDPAEIPDDAILEIYTFHYE